jgi:heat shock protein HslJ
MPIATRPNWRAGISARFVIAIVVFLWHGTSVAMTPPPALGAMANATYPGIMEVPVTLHDGTWEGKPYSEGGASRPRVTLVSGFRVAGDLDGDGMPEAVVLLAASTGGSGTFSHLAAVSHAGTGVTVRGVALLGDRVQVRYARIEDGELVIDTIEAGEGDAACCPGEKRQRLWRLAGDVLEEQPVEALGRTGPDDLGGGITWRLTHLARNDQVKTATPPTLSYEEGKLAGFAGCNRYFGAVVAGDGPGELKLGPFGATRMACDADDMTLESTFLRRLESAQKFSFIGGQLALTYREGERVELLSRPSSSLGPSRT